jgi:class 3 adenylate cyclase/tetratricopeptide (TPR) repeat protein
MALMRCPQCGFENRDRVRFCEDCGTRLELFCPACQAPILPGRRFCGQCGQPLGGPAPSPLFASPERYTPPHLAEKILTSRAALEGERKQVTVLFADVKGSLELLADRDPEDARALLDPVVERMMEAVHRYEGTVNQVLGDGIMALFGAPVAHEDHAVRACYAALAMQAAMRRDAEAMRRTHGVEVQIRVGMNSGEVVVRAIGNDLHMDYSAIGQTTHLAARMEQLAAPGTIRLTGTTLRLAEGFVQVQALGPVPVKGIGEPVEVFELAGVTPTRTRMQASARRGLTRFVGRLAELDQLGQALARVRDGRGQVRALIGEPGVGKSRLLWEFTRSHRTQGCLVLETGAASYGRATAYRPVVDLLQAYFESVGHDDRRLAETITGKVLTLDRALEPILPPLLALMNVPVEDAGWWGAEPPARRARTLEAVKRLLLRESENQPLLLVFEDLHWVDPETQAVLDALVDDLPGARILVLASYRPEYQHSWGRRPYFAQLRIEPLPPERAEELLEALVGDDPGLRDFTRVLIERTEGNPFFLEECVRTLVETGVLSGQRGRYRLATAQASTEVPRSVQAVLAARIDRLRADDKRLLQTAAVVGKDVLFVLLQAIADLPEPELRHGLSRLQAAEFLYEQSLFPELEYTFKHALTHDVAYASVLQERRRAIHARVVDAIERLFAERPGEHIEQLGHHALRGEVWDKALHYVRQAGARAFARSANREALGWFEQALGALARLPESPDTRELAIDLRLDLRSALGALGETAKVFECLTEAGRLAEALGDPRRIARVSGHLTNFYGVVGEYGRALEAGRRTLAIGEALGDPRIGIVAGHYVAAAHYFRGDYREAVELHRRNLTLIQGDLLTERFDVAIFPAVACRTHLAGCLAELGEFAEGLEHAQAAVELAAALKHPLSQIFADLARGYLLWWKGDLADAIAPLEHGLMLCRTSDTPILFPAIGAVLGSAYAVSGRLQEGIALLERAVEVTNAMRVVAGASLILGQLGHGYLVAGREDEATKVTGHAVELARQRGERGWEAASLRILADVHSQRDTPEVEPARATYLQAVALAETLGMRPLLARCHLGLGALGRRCGQAGDAREHLTIAGGLFRAMEMHAWAARATAELEALG